MSEAFMEKYPDSDVKITSPFFTLACGCGFRMWSLLGEITPCPKCGRLMLREEGRDVSKKAYI